MEVVLSGSWDQDRMWEGGEIVKDTAVLAKTLFSCTCAVFLLVAAIHFFTECVLICNLG